MSDFDPNPGADPHTNGTIWAAALWDLRNQIAANEPEEARNLDRMILLGLLLLGRLKGDAGSLTPAKVRRARRDFGTALCCLLEADDILYAGRHQDAALRVFSRRGILIHNAVKTGT